MQLRQIAGLLLMALGLWLGWASLQWLLLYTGRGAPFGEAVLDPVFLMPGLRALVALLGGLLALGGFRFAAPLAFVALVLSAVLTGAIFAAGGDVTLWLQPALVTAALLILFAVLAFTPRRPAT